MIVFRSKMTCEIDKKELCFDDERKLQGQIKEIFQLSQCEIILIYEGEQYCGYIEKENMEDIVTPEFYLGFEPLEFEASDNLIEEIIEYKSKNKRMRKQIRIPLKNRKTEGVRDFIEDGDDELKLSEYLKAYERYQNAPFLLESYPDKKVVSFEECNEFTYRCLKILEKRNQKYFVKGKNWNYFNVCEEAVRDIEESEILECDYLLVADILESWVKKAISEKISSMKEVNVYKIILPCYEELNVHGELEEKIRSCSDGVVFQDFLCKTADNGKLWIDILMKTECCETEEDLKHISWPEQYGGGEATIYLAGPCIVQGTTTEKSSLAHMLYQKVRNMPYKVKKLVIGKHDISLVERLDTLDFKKQDILFFITDSHMYQKKADDIDLLDDYNHRRIDHYLFLDEPIHALRRGNEIIAEKLCPLIEKVYEQNKENRYIQTGRPYLNEKQKKELQQYVNSVGFEKRDGVTGCIVMNANPFTQGHLYLAQWASKEVDELLIFVVEEDLSEFAYTDRYQMVREGTKHIKNIRVIPSGRFILSNQTFGSYFDKDKKQEQKVDAAFDVNFFGAYIAPAFGIHKRFVGEEPGDSVTRQYNEEMKQKLPLYGVEVIEIPRKEAQGKVISATAVRKWYETKEWEKLSCFLPDSTLEYLKLNKVEMRNKDEVRMKREIPDRLLQGLQNVLSQYGKIIFYAVGRDCKGLYSLLSTEEKKKVVFVDKRAEEQEISFEGKRVYEPETLLGEFREFPILITSTLFGGQIYVELKEQGINISRLMQNVYSFVQV